MVFKIFWCFVVKSQIFTTLQRQFVYIFLFLELRGLSPNFHIHVSVSDLYIYSQDRSTYFLQQKKQTHRGNIKLAHRHMNVETGAEAPIFLCWEYLFQIFGILSLQCSFYETLNNYENPDWNPLQRACSGFLLHAFGSLINCSESWLRFWKLFRKLPVKCIFHWFSCIL